MKQWVMTVLAVQLKVRTQNLLVKLLTQMVAEYLQWNGRLIIFLFGCGINTIFLLIKTMFYLKIRIHQNGNNLLHVGYLEIIVHLSTLKIIKLYLI